MPRQLAGLNCVITGASSGIGAALAHELNTRGARLLLTARRAEKLDELNHHLGGSHVTLAADVSHPDDCRRIVDTAFDQLGRVDVLVANAGYGVSKPAWQHTPEEVRRLFATNVFGTHDLVHFAVPRLREQVKKQGLRGQIVIVSSAAARRGLPFFGPYAATKAAQLSLAEALRVELADEAIAVTSVHPIGTGTEFFNIAEQGGTTRVQGIGSRGRQQTPEYVARRIAGAIRRPAREVWPARSYRYLLGLSSVLPSIGDRVMRHMKRQIDAAALAADQDGPPMSTTIS